MKIFYRPAKIYLVIDILILLLSFYVVLDWFPLTTDSPFEKYSIASLCYTISWIVFSYLLSRYKPLKKQKYFKSILRLFYTCLILFILYWVILHNFFKAYSGFVLLTITLGVFFVNYIFQSLYFAYRYAIEYNEVSFLTVKKRVNATVKKAEPLDERSYEQLCSTISSHSANCVLNFFKKHIDLQSGNTKVYVETTPENLKMYPNYQFSTIVQLERLNNMQRINKSLSIINEKLADDGVFICCFESKSTRKKRIIKAYPLGINYLFYIFDFLFKRVMPKIFLTSKFYYFITQGKNRIFSKTEVLGRLYCFGFNVILEKKIGQLTYVISKRVKQPESAQKRIYGPLIRLRRFGRNGKSFEVYKMRTMHPYSEYLQSYIYTKNSLKEGGKFNKDIRVTNIGSFMRKYWLDELPMILNLLKGEMKLVGVRPLSAHYLSLYSMELQDRRKKYKPGLLPPFYADMPKTIEEIQASEMKYLIACEINGVFITDLKYIYLILKNILIKKARSS
ncbi:MAG: sugar transferase [Paludibacter sp.]|nr:sugar transferase [Paludibacter sp.]